MKSSHSYGGIKTMTLSPVGVSSLWIALLVIFPTGTYILLREFFLMALILDGVFLFLVVFVIVGATFKLPGFEKL
jgi:hypothetical protein